MSEPVEANGASEHERDLILWSPGGLNGRHILATTAEMLLGPKTVEKWTTWYVLISFLLLLVVRGRIVYADVVWLWHEFFVVALGCSQQAWLPLPRNASMAWTHRAERG